MCLIIMSVSKIVSDAGLRKVNNGLWWATLTSATLIPLGIATEELIARKMNMRDCNHSRYEIRKQLLVLITGGTLLSFFLGYRSARNNLLRNN